MRLGDISGRDVAARLHGEGLLLQTGPFRFRLQSPFPELAMALHHLYSGAIVPDANETVNFHLRLQRALWPWQWWRPSTVLVRSGEVVSRAEPRGAALALLEWAMNSCIWSTAHQYLVVHAAVVERHGQAALLCGPPASGKSTLCAALVLRGWRLLSDEMAILRPEDGRLVALARPVCLKNESITVIRRFEPSAQFGPTCPGTAKGTVTHMKPPADSTSRIDELARPAWVCFPSYSGGASLSQVPCSQGESLRRLARNSFNYSMLGVRGFDTLIDLVQACHCFDLTYGNLDEAVAALEALAPVTRRTLAEVAT